MKRIANLYDLENDIRNIYDRENLETLREEDDDFTADFMLGYLAA
tara:strand:- start:723 stop:857 length:135 start_codon:yes stop_codon:yes gene_type:complete